MSKHRADTLDAEARALPGGRDGVFSLPYDSEWRVVRRYEPESTDGHRVIVSVLRLPAIGYRIECPDLNLRLSTGTGMGVAELVHSIAEALAEGMLASFPKPVVEAIRMPCPSCGAELSLPGTVEVRVV